LTYSEEELKLLTSEQLHRDNAAEKLLRLCTIRNVVLVCGWLLPAFTIFVCMMSAIDAFNGVLFDDRDGMGSPTPIPFREGLPWWLAAVAFTIVIAVVLTRRLRRKVVKDLPG